MYSKLQREIDEAIDQQSISKPVQVVEALNLPHLQACIKEGLRIFPPVASLRERVTPAGGDDLGGFYVPAGVNVGFSLRSMQRNVVFGSDPDVSRPERWLETDIGQRKEMEKIHELIFNYGSAKCLGINIAYLTLNKFFVEVSLWLS